MQLRQDQIYILVIAAESHFSLKVLKVMENFFTRNGSVIIFLVGALHALEFQWHFTSILWKLFSSFPTDLWRQGYINIAIWLFCSARRTAKALGGISAYFTGKRFSIILAMTHTTTHTNGPHVKDVYSLFSWKSSGRDVSFLHRERKILFLHDKLFLFLNIYF